MKSIDTHKVILPTGDTSGKATTPAFAQVMNLLIRILTKLGLLKEDLDYHVVRASMVIIYFFFGYQKWFEYEAQTLPHEGRGSFCCLVLSIETGRRKSVTFGGFGKRHLNFSKNLNLCKNLELT